MHAVFEIDSAKKHFESFRFEAKLGLGFVAGFWSSERPALQSFHENPQTRSIPIEHFDTVGTLVEEDEELGREQVFFELFRDDAAEGVEAFAKIAGLGGETDVDAVGEDYGCEGAGAWMRGVRPPGTVGAHNSLRGEVLCRAGV